MSSALFGETIIEFNGLSTSLLPSSIKVGDYVQWNGELVKVITIQRNCPSLTKLSHTFTMFTCVSAQGNVLPIRNLFGKQIVIQGRNVQKCHTLKNTERF